MEEKMNNITIQVPDGYEIDKSKSTYDNVVFKKRNDIKDKLKDLTTFDNILWYYAKRNSLGSPNFVMKTFTDTKELIRNLTYHSKCIAARFKAHIIQWVMFDINNSTLESYYLKELNIYKAVIALVEKGCKTKLGDCIVYGMHKKVCIKEIQSSKSILNLDLSNVFLMPSKDIAKFTAMFFWDIYVTMQEGNARDFKIL